MSIAARFGEEEKEAAVTARYSMAAQEREAALCCAVEYPEEYLNAIPDEILRVDYGCGDPTPYREASAVCCPNGDGDGKCC